MPPKISATLITKDEAKHIEAVVGCLSFADEIIILDSGSTDDTVELARAAGATVSSVDWPGYGVQKNRAAALARNDWILNVDGDELIDDELASAIAALPDDPTEAAFKLLRRNFFADHALRHWPWAWDSTVRLYDRRRAAFAEVVVHEGVETDGSIGRLSGALDHYCYEGWDDFLDRQVRYARLSAIKMRKAGKRFRSIDLATRPTFAFLRQFIIRGHLLSGRTGLRFSVLSAFVTYLKYLLLDELEKGRGE